MLSHEPEGIMQYVPRNPRGRHRRLPDIRETAVLPLRSPPAGRSAPAGRRIVRVEDRLQRSVQVPAFVIQTRSRTLEMPSGLSLPLAFGIYTRLIGSGR